MDLILRDSIAWPVKVEEPVRSIPVDVVPLTDSSSRLGRAALMLESCPMSVQTSKKPDIVSSEDLII